MDGESRDSIEDDVTRIGTGQSEEETLGLGSRDVKTFWSHWMPFLTLLNGVKHWASSFFHQLTYS